MERVLVDTGFLVALGRVRDEWHSAATAWLEACTLQLVTVSAVIVEACHFLDVDARLALLDWLANGGPAVVEVPPEAYPGLAGTMARYRERDVDFADAALLWLAQQTGDRRVLTADDRDFRRFRFKGGGRFELVEWR
jgi:predicted nucleic acid-binding protein